MIGGNIKKIRKRAGMTQDGLARKAEIPYPALTKIEPHVVKKPSVQTIAKIAKALNVNIGEPIK